MDYEDEASVDNDLFLDTAGHCFLCLEKVRKIPGDSQNVYLSSSATFFDKKVYSFQYPSHYLKIDKTKVFSEAAHIPPYLLKKVRTSELKLELCDDCATVSEKFSKFGKQLERLRMEVAACVRTFMDKIVKSKDLAKNLRERSGLNLQNVNIAQRVRAETLDKCKLSLKLEVPQVKLKRIAVSEVVLRQSNFESDLGTVVESHQEEEQLFAADIHEEVSSHFPFSPSFSPAPPSPHMETEIKPVIAASSRSPRIIKLRIIKKRKTLERKTKTVKLPCPRCNRTFAEKFALRIHLKTTHNLTAVGTALHDRCNLCGNFYPTKNKLYKHKRNVHVLKFRLGPSQFECPTCEQIFTEAPFLLKHQETYHSLYFEDEQGITDLKVCEYTARPTQFACKLCANFYHRQGALTAHLRNTHGYKFKVAPGRFKCPGCQGDFKDLQGFLEHQEKEHPWKKEKENGVDVPVKTEMTMENSFP